jgi:hypothetical protein
LSSTYSYGKYPNLDLLVPPGLARLLCARNCVVTRNISSLEPGQFQRKYYAPGNRRVPWKRRRKPERSIAS